MEFLKEHLIITIVASLFLSEILLMFIIFIVEKIRDRKPSQNCTSAYSGDETNRHPYCGSCGGKGTIEEISWEECGRDHQGLGCYGACGGQKVSIPCPECGDKTNSNI